MINNWLAYPSHRPQPNQTYDDFLVAYLNPRFINKAGFRNGAPKYCQTVDTWNGDSWQNLNHYKITHFQPLPELPED